MHFGNWNNHRRFVSNCFGLHQNRIWLVRKIIIPRWMDGFSGLLILRWFQYKLPLHNWLMDIWIGRSRFLCSRKFDSRNHRTWHLKSRKIYILRDIFKIFRLLPLNFWTLGSIKETNGGLWGGSGLSFWK